MKEIKEEYLLSSTLETLDNDDLGVLPPISLDTISKMLQKFKDQVVQINLLIEHKSVGHKVCLLLIHLKRNNIITPITFDKPNQTMLKLIIDCCLAPIIYLNLTDKFAINDTLAPHDAYKLAKLASKEVDEYQTEVSLEVIHRIYCAKQMNEKFDNPESLLTISNDSIFNEETSIHDIYLKLLDEIITH